MKRLQLILLILLLSAGIALAKGIGTRIGIVIGPGGTTTSSGDAVLWDASGDVVLWDASGDKVLWD